MVNISEIIAELTSVSEDVETNFGALSLMQLNWRPAAGSWSIAQCLDHLILTNDRIAAPVRKVADGTHSPSFWEKWSPLTGFSGSFLVRSMSNDSKKFKAPSKSIVPPSEIGGDIVQRFKANNDDLIGLFGKLEGADLEGTVISSPFMGLMTYRLSDGLLIVARHERRHVRQAERVMAAQGFPA
jgi:hypothetical protein